LFLWPYDVSANRVSIREFPLSEYTLIYDQMREFSRTREATSVDEFWVLEHEPVYTLGLNGKDDHLFNTGNIPVVNVDRGGQVTYHGPGQLIVYLLIDIRRRALGVRAIVTGMENALIDLLMGLGIEANAKPDAPGVYVGKQKIAALGLRIKNGKSYHGLSLNIDMDLTPFNGINPCGYKNLTVVNIQNFNSTYSKKEITKVLIQHLMTHLDYTEI